MSVDDRGGWLVLAVRRGCWVVVALLLTGCSLVPTFPGGTRDLSELVPVAALQIHGSYLDGHLDIRGADWRIVLQSTDGRHAEDERTAGSVTACLLDSTGSVLAERHVVPAGAPEGTAARDAEEAGAFGLLLTTDRPAHAEMLQVEAEGISTRNASASRSVSGSARSRA